MDRHPRVPPDTLLPPYLSKVQSQRVQRNFPLSFCPRKDGVSGPLPSVTSLTRGHLCSRARSYCSFLSFPSRTRTPAPPVLDHDVYPGFSPFRPQLLIPCRLHRPTSRPPTRTSPTVSQSRTRPNRSGSSVLLRHLPKPVPSLSQSKNFVGVWGLSVHPVYPPLSFSLQSLAPPSAVEPGLPTPHPAHPDLR